ncbi:hypothetical protein [Bacillus benzoevorans]|uniref:Uncharacterized protein n=1 Tax=Bacillus benzoevorans TaxID=1456 RepID=A0A7X0HMU5_9BACI|nr:hypothetical protein [Bacillus benzoevorans]MBB6443689.1 hypothetical protein [Bacillus benzoevorans]
MKKKEISAASALSFMNVLVKSNYIWTEKDEPYGISIPDRL